MLLWRFPPPGFQPPDQRGGEINFWKALGITALVTLVSVVLLVVVSSLSAWVMVRNRSRFSNILLLMFTAAMLVPFQAVMYPLISLMENLQ